MAKDPLKVVVRLLPPEITEEELLATVGQAHAERAKWRSFVPGKRYKGEAKPSLNARCYFKFEALKYAEEFIKDYHGHQFIDGQGEQFRAVACFAPYQKVPRMKPQKDPRENTITDDPQYKEFLESLGSSAVYEAPPDPKVLLKPLDYGDTPLLKFMQNRAKERRARKEKQEKRRSSWREMEAIPEDPKKAKWRCAECGTSKHLEEDPDDRGTFYCTYCWESWEAQAAAAPKPQKKKKKKKEAEAYDETEWQETEEVTYKKKKKKKDKDYEDEEPKSEWRAKEKASHGAEEEEDTEKRRKAKKEESWKDWEEEDDRGKGNRWRVKKPDASEDYAQENPAKAKKPHKGRQEEWWEEDRGHRRSDWRSEKPEPETVEDSRGSRWRAKAPAAATEEKSRRRPRKGEGSDGSQWRPKG